MFKKVLHDIFNGRNVYRHINFEKVKEITDNGSKTLLESFKNRFIKNPNNCFLGSIKDGNLIYESNEEFNVKLEKLSAFLKTISKKGDFVGIYSINRPEWVLTEYAGYAANCPNVPLYSTFQPEAIMHVLEETQMSILIASAVKAKSLLENVIFDSTFNLKHLVLMDDDEEISNLYKEKNIEIYSLKSILNNPQIELKEEQERDSCKPTDIATICYTSGTTGVPKGVILQHRNFISHMSGYCNAQKGDFPFLDENTVYLSYLPLAHVFERICFSVATLLGAKIAFFRGDVKLLQKDYEIIKPTFVAAVPRVLNIFEEKIMKEVNQKNFILRGIFKLAIKYKKWRQTHGVFKTPILDKLIFKKVADKFGGNLKICLCGGSSINPNTLSFIQAALCMRVFQGYGSSEGLAANIVQPLSYIENNTVGIPFPSTEICLNPVEGYPENCGEILMKGPSIFSGYYLQPELTKKAFLVEDNQKWFKSGDIAKFENERFYIVGRVKEMFKTTYGEYISPEYLENCFTSDIIEDIFITAQRFSDSLFAIIYSSDPTIPKEVFIQYLKDKGGALVKDKKINKYEIPTNVFITNTPFNELDDGNLITPSFKKRRTLLFKYFEEEINKEMEN